MSIRSVDVKAGFWIDYGRRFPNKYLYLCTDTVASIWTNAIAVLIAVAIAKLVLICLKKIKLSLPADPDDELAFVEPVALSRVSSPLSSTSSIVFQNHLRTNSFKSRQDCNQIQSSVEGVFLSGRRLWEIITTRSVSLDDVDSNEETELVDVVRRSWRNVKYERTNVVTLLSILMICVLFFALEYTLSIFSSLIILNDNVALSKSPKCGYYRPWGNDPIPINVTRNIDYETEINAAVYAQNCYDKINRSEAYGDFVQERLQFHEVGDPTCPFGRDLCPANQSSAYALSTGYVTATDLGFNVRENYRYKRTLTCSPINMNSSYIREETINGSRVTSYYYGKSLELGKSNNYTWRHSSDSSSSVPGYEALIFTASPVDDSDWQPISNLRSDGNDTTLFLIRSNDIYHSTPRNDPIFSASTQKHDPIKNSNISFFTDTSHTYKAMACLEETIICTPDKSYCQRLDSQPPGTGDWPSNTSPQTTKGDMAVLLMSTLMSNSKISSTIHHRVGSGLVATSKLSGRFSLPLPAEQWKIEIRRLFQTSLAGMQVLARDIERGRWADEPGLLDHFGHYSSEYRNGLCGMYKFRVTGWRNVNVIWSGVVIVTTVMILLISIEIEYGNGPLRWISRRKGVRSVVKIVLIPYHACRRFAVWIMGGYVGKQAKLLKQKIRMYWTK